MNAREFLELLLPTTGFIFTATPANKGWVNVSHTAIDSAVQHVNKLTFDNQAAYFALATYEKERVWDPTWKDASGKVVGKWRQRTQGNAQFIKSFFLDLDVDPADGNKFESKSQALSELRDLVRKIGLPRPMLIDSGGGIHAYWPLSLAVPTSEWRPIADQLKTICLQEKFRADRSLTSDQARVLRVLGSYNTRRGAAVKLLTKATGAISFTDFAQRVTDYASAMGVAAPRVNAGALVPGLQANVFEDNLGATNDPLHFDRIVFGCAQMAQQVAVRGKGVGEQLWRAGLGLVKFCEPCEPGWRAISDAHPDFDPVATVAKMDNWHTGPTACAHFHQLNPKVCEGCPHHQRITSPAVLGRQVIPQPTPQVIVEDELGTTVITLPDPPTGYTRRKDGAIVRESEDKDGGIQYEVICPYDLYPLAIRTQNGVDNNIDERSTWRAHIPIDKGAGTSIRDIDVPLGMLADQRALSKYLNSKGVILMGDQPQKTQMFMSAYLQRLAEEAGRDKLYERLGWHDDHHTFVLGDRVLRRGQKPHPHTAGEAIRNTTKNGLHSKGTHAGWLQAMTFYNRPGYEGHRFFLYAALGAPLFHMNDTGNRGILLTASGKSGRGKTTCLKACGSLWGHPESLILNGNKDGSTVNALYSAIGTTHSLPFMWDDITERDPDELRRFLLNISQGQGKRRMTADSVQSNKVDSWETIVLATANTDDISRILSTGKDVDPHLMRMVGVEFNAIDAGTESKIKADDFLRALNQNYGHVGPAYMKAIVDNYDGIARGYVKNVAMVDRMLNSNNASAERYWSAAVAAAYTGAQVASRLCLIQFPFEADLQWMISHLTRQRDTIRESNSSPLELLTTFLNASIRSTLILSAKQASNLDNVAHRPNDELLIRHELDNDVIYASRTAVMNYCAENRIGFRQFERQLEAEGVVVARNVQKVLGSDTIYSAGQTRCWRIDSKKLGGLAGAAPAAALPSNVVPIGGKAA